MAFLISTTGTQATVVLNDLAGRSFTHPVVDFDLELTNTADEIADSDDLQAAIDAGSLTAKDENDEPIDSVSEATSAVPLATQAEAESGASTDRRMWSPERVTQAVATKATPAIVPLTEEAPDNADFLVFYDASASNYKKVKVEDLPLGEEDLVAAQARRTTTFTVNSTTWQDIDLDTTDLENDDTVIEHDDTNRDRVVVKQAALYLVSFDCDAQAIDDISTLEMRVLKNDTTLVPGTYTSPFEGEPDDDVSRLPTSRTVVVELVANDFLTVQAQRTGVNWSVTNLSLKVVRLRGAKGEKGDTGAGSSVSLEDNGSPVAGGPFDTINFTGSPVSVSDAGGGQANVAVAEKVYGDHWTEEENTTDESTTGSWDTTPHLVLTTPDLPLGDYKLEWNYIWRNSSTQGDFQAKILLNSTNTGGDPGILDPDWHRQEPKDPNSDQRHFTGFSKILKNISGVQVFRLYYGNNGNGTATIYYSNMQFKRVA